MQKMTRRNFVKAAGTTAVATMAAGALAACSSSDNASSQKDVATDAQEDSFMEEGKGKHLVCAVTGKLIKIAPAILAEQLGYFEEEGCRCTLRAACP